MRKTVMSVNLAREHLTPEMIIKMISDIVPSLIEYIYPEIITKIISAPKHSPTVVDITTLMDASAENGHECKFGERAFNS